MDDFVAALRNGDAKTVERLVSSGIDVNFCDEDGWSSLFYAVTSGNIASIKALLRAGADATHRDADGMTAADYASMFGDEPLAVFLSKAIAR